MSGEGGRYNFVYDNWVEGIDEEDAREHFLRELKKEDRELKMFIDCIDFQSEDDDYY